jgi:hypothetical protein
MKTTKLVNFQQLSVRSRAPANDFCITSFVFQIQTGCFCIFASRDALFLVSLTFLALFGLTCRRYHALVWSIRFEQSAAKAILTDRNEDKEIW